MRKLLAALLLALPFGVQAQAWPQKPVKMIVPFAAGGGTDYVARIAAQHLSKRLGQQVYVENRGGANGSIGLQALKQSDPDGYTISACSDTPLTVNPSLYANVQYDPLRDFIAVANMVKLPGLLAVHPSVPARTLAELIALAKTKPGTLAYASGGVGNYNHLAGELLASATGTKLLHVPFKGTGPATAALLSGDVQMMFNNIQTSIELVRSGKIVALAVSEPERVPSMPNVPAMAETLPGFDVAPWVGVVAPARTPPEIVARLGEATLAVFRDPEVTKILNDQFVQPMPLDREQFTALLKKDLAKWAGVIKNAGIKAE